MTAANCRCVKRVSGGNMATWNSRGLRGSTLEEFINRTNEIYQENGLALIQKILAHFLYLSILHDRCCQIRFQHFNALDQFFF